ncbi:alkaline phosphatase [Myxococcus sp. RHSTA-1-4]|uniref:alkaline phosphatase D family protein n=1 Tax=Myxococcus sp. RHSTA-1-4 TaxID=2874601 RepID=UPI001CBF6D15|nr:alkaline phosphatase D family protein [Myxococcus sp. RHSTA-1-4]MBZ4414894.1 alkaline phosphatase D family protein [Myxococcus sp. RHSTA-1-4]
MFDKFKRRSFLQAVVAVAASTAFGCSDDENGAPPSDDRAKYFPQSVASGDPRADSVVLWVRAVDPDNASADARLRLEVSTSEDFGTLVLNEQFSALAQNDHALKVKVTNLSPRTTYYYRFTFEKDGQKFTTATGRTRTAPAAGDDVPVKFAFASCQDYIGRYFNAWQRLLQLNPDLDFIVFLGDYIYETTGDASFQSSNGQRSVFFSEPEKALRQGKGLAAFYAANALSNYRDLYKNLRTDKVIQRVHERYPFIVMWDDHEFSDDCHGATATYTDGLTNEEQVERRRNAEQAFFEYIPLDNTNANAGAIDPTAAPRFPDTRIYRDFEFGRNLKLVVTDFRTHRPDHLIPEDAYPGTVALTEQELRAALPALPEAVQAQVQGMLASGTFAYVDIDAEVYSNHKLALQGAYVQQAMQAGLTQEQAAAKAAGTVKGGISVYYANQVLDAVNEARRAAGAPALPRFPTAGEGVLHGLAFVHMGKPGLFGIQGSRYIVVKPAFDLFAGVKYQLGRLANPPKNTQNALGTEQREWFLQSVQATNTWKIIVSSVSLTSMVFDLSGKTDIPDPTLRQTFYFNVDQWDGFPTEKAALLGTLKASGVQNALFISGDIHASFASVEGGVPTLTAPAISSGSIKELAGLALLGAGYGSGSTVYRYIVKELEDTMKAAHRGMRFADGDAHGFVMMEVKADEALATFHLIPSSEITKDYSLRTDEELSGKFATKQFRIKNDEITAI